MAWVIRSINRFVGWISRFFFSHSDLLRLHQNDAMYEAMIEEFRAEVRAQEALCATQRAESEEKTRLFAHAFGICWEHAHPLLSDLMDFCDEVRAMGSLEYDEFQGIDETIDIIFESFDPYGLGFLDFMGRMHTFLARVRQAMDSGILIIPPERVTEAEERLTTGISAQQAFMDVQSAYESYQSALHENETKLKKLLENLEGHERDWIAYKRMRGIDDGENDEDAHLPHED